MKFLVFCSLLIAGFASADALGPNQSFLNGPQAKRTWDVILKVTGEDPQHFDSMKGSGKAVKAPAEVNCMAFDKAPEQPICYVNILK